MQANKDEELRRDLEGVVETPDAPEASLYSDPKPNLNPNPKLNPKP